MTYRQPIKRLEQALASWEEMNFLDRARRIATSEGFFSDDNLPPPLPFYRQFRNYLLKATPETPFDMDRFWGNKSGVTPYNEFRTQDLHSIHLFSWTVLSRRVFHLPAHDSVLLRHTSLKGLRWSEIRPPFQSFAVTLEKPLPYGEDQIDCLVMTDGGTEFAFCGFGPPSKEGKYIGPLAKEQIRKALKRKRWNRAIQLTEPWWDTWEERRPTHVHFNAPKSDLPIEDSHEPVLEELDGSETAGREDLAETFSQGLRLFGNLCQALRHLPSVTVISNRNEARRGRSVDPRAITNGADIATVALFGKIGTSAGGTRDARGTPRGGWEAPTHWRRGFWRRPNGQGHIPDAPRTIWVRPTLVRADRLPEDSLPGGTQTVTHFSKRKKG